MKSDYELVSSSRTWTPFRTFRHEKYWKNLDFETNYLFAVTGNARIFPKFLGRFTRIKLRNQRKNAFGRINKNRRGNVKKKTRETNLTAFYTKSVETRILNKNIYRSRYVLLYKNCVCRVYAGDRRGPEKSACVYIHIYIYIVRCRIW